MTLRTKGVDSTKAPPRPQICSYNNINSPIYRPITLNVGDFIYWHSNLPDCTFRILSPNFANYFLFPSYPPTIFQVQLYILKLSIFASPKMKKIAP